MLDREEFAQALLDPSLSVPGGMIRPDGKPALRRFDIYRNNVVKSLVDALGDGFPVIQAIVGETFFRAMAAAFVRTNPPRSPCIIFYGDGFPAFIDDFVPAKGLTYLGDIARLEHARRQSYFAADDCRADPVVLQGLGSKVLGETRMALRASCGIVRSKHPIWSIWRYNVTDEKSAIEPGAEDVLVSRPGDSVLLAKLPPGSADFLLQLRDGESLGEAARLAGRKHSGFDLGTSLGVILRAGIIKSIIV